MTSNVDSSLDKTKELLNKITILEKFIELKSNECAYYRTKVHLMQMNSLDSQLIRKSFVKQDKQSSNEDYHHSHSSTTSVDQQDSNKLLPLKQSIKSKYLPFSSSIRKYRKELHGKNQNHHEEYFSHKKSSVNNRNSSRLSKKTNLNTKILLSFLKKHLQQSNSHNKTIQCNDIDLHPIEFLSKSSHIVLIIRLPENFIKSLLEKQKRNLKIPKLKVHVSSELLKKLFQSFHSNSIATDKNDNQFTIDSQYGKIAARIHHENSIDNNKCKTMCTKAKVKCHHEHRLPIIRHVIRARSNGSDKRKIMAEKNFHSLSHKYRRKKKHLPKSTSNTSLEEINSKQSSSTNEIQSIETLTSSSDRTNNSISIQNNKIKRIKRK